MAQPCTGPLDALPHLVNSLPGRYFNAAGTREFYKKRGDICAWDDISRQQLLAKVNRVAEEGIDIRFFDTSKLAGIAPQDAEAARENDLLLTDLALRYARIMSLGQINLTRIEDDISVSRPRRDFATDLGEALTLQNFSGWLHNLGPRPVAYKRLKDMLAYYRLLQKTGGWQMLPPGRALKPGTDNPIVPELRNRLLAEADLTENLEGTLFDPTTVDALKRFQARHGLTADGWLGPLTRSALNVPVEARIDQIIANLDRWRYVGSALPATRVEVNAAAGLAELVIDEKPVLSMRAISGKPKNPTPILLSAIDEVIVNPSWTIPRSIVRNEISKLIRRDPNYLAHNHMHWINGWLVQAPGPENPLGRIKFDFPNPFSVYLHDTPYVDNFALDDRARSHGCVRLERPLDLADYLLKEKPEWSRPNLEAAISAIDTVRIPLSLRYPVAILYWTAFVNADGIFELRNDIYGRDERHSMALAGEHD